MTQKQVFIHWKIEAITIIFIVICISTSLYLAFLSLQTLDQNLSKQLVTIAASFLITGTTIFTALTAHLGIKKGILKNKKIANSKNRTLKHKKD